MGAGLLDDDQGVESAPQSIVRGRSWKTIAVAGVLLLLGIGLSVARGSGSIEPAAPPSSPATSEPRQPEGAGSTDSYVGAIDTEHMLVVLADGTITAIDLATGRVAPVPIPEPAVGTSLATLEDAVAFVGRSGAWAIALDGSAPMALGAADAVLDAAAPTRIWLGNEAIREPEIPIIDWTEIDATGAVTRTTERELPMEFDLPELVWGFNSALYRLEDRDVHPWRYIAQGFPVAVGPNDLVLNVCTADRDCRRLWYDVQTGEDKGELLADIADNIVRRYGGLISPTGRFVSQDAEDSGLQLWSVATGVPVDNGCSGVDGLAWSADDSILACLSADGLVVHELGSSRRMLVGGDLGPVDAYVLVGTGALSG